MARRNVGAIRVRGEHTEAEIERVFESVGRTLRQAIQYHMELATEARERAHESERFAKKIEQDTLAGHWWKLEGLLEPDEIELMSEVEPTDRSELLRGGD